MQSLSIYEFDAVSEEDIPKEAYRWLEQKALNLSENQEISWLKLVQRKGKRAVQFSNYVGVICAANGFQIEVLPKIGKVNSAEKARKLLLKMLFCLREFRSIQSERALLSSQKMPLWEIFISEFLNAVQHIIKRGLRSDYVSKEANLFALRGKLHMTQHLKQNICRRDRFFVSFDEFLPDRAENRLLHAALKRVLHWTNHHQNQKLAHELCFAFAEIPESKQITHDFQKVRLDRGMAYYEPALIWARLILDNTAPLTGIGQHHATSLLFPMEVLFESFVAKHLNKQLNQNFQLKAQAKSHHLLQHREYNWFLLKPDLLICEQKQSKVNMVLDTKWKLINQDAIKDKYSLNQSDLYQMYAYGQYYMDSEGDVVLIYPKTDNFQEALPVFNILKSKDLKFWVLPFCMDTNKLVIPNDSQFPKVFKPDTISAS